MLSTPETDMFGDPVQTPATMIEVEGQLCEDAQVRMHLSSEGRAHPVLHLYLSHVGPALRHVRAEKPFANSSRFAADAIALRLKRGTRVRIAATFEGACLTLQHTETITPL